MRVEIRLFGRSVDIDVDDCNPTVIMDALRVHPEIHTYIKSITLDEATDVMAGLIRQVEYQLERVESIGCGEPKRR